ncbi:MAG TPA: PIG-L family deacetylase [Bacteroidales bacterium]|nr:PIG-L family deacetylase [Bacteroidales bacterium]HPF01654.1 PIG-L family deacetylase [Bacteroidales bacterium]HPJ58663.1 PIG-L family deacetylase [Bacteroidales bacterium]HPR12350.1 PIG-L family deacetylase [Bacteroidales bacterium]HRW84570.1 PIG-L family deacetylase [Bacteroidales bacterium]
MIPGNIKNILVLAPHTDDGELGAGGTISWFLEKKAKVWYAAFSTAKDSVPEGMPGDILKKEVRKATKKLGIDPENLIIFDYQVRKLNYCRQEILEDLIMLRKRVPYDLILMPSLNDIHQDHMTLSQEGLRAFKTTTILGYELIWNNLTFNTTCFVRLEERHLQNKINALKCYESQKGRSYVTADFVRSLAKARGVQIGAEYAEAFEVIRWVI